MDPSIPAETVNNGNPFASEQVNGMLDEGVVMSPPPPANFSQEHSQQATSQSEVSHGTSGDLYGDLVNLDQTDQQCHSVTSPSLVDSRYEFDASDMTSPPPSSLFDEVMASPPPPEVPNNDVILVDLEAAANHEADIHELSTASVTPQSPPYNFDSFDPLQPDPSSHVQAENGLVTHESVSSPAQDAGILASLSAPPVETTPNQTASSHSDQLFAFEDKLKDLDLHNQPESERMNLSSQQPDLVSFISSEAAEVVPKENVTNQFASSMVTSVIEQSESSSVIETHKVNEHHVEISEKTVTSEKAVTSEEIINVNTKPVEKPKEAVTNNLDLTSQSVVEDEKSATKPCSQEAPGAPRPESGTSSPKAPTSPVKKQTSIPSPKKDIPGSPRRSAPGSPSKSAAPTRKSATDSSQKKPQDKSKDVTKTKPATPRSADKVKSPTKPASPREVAGNKTPRTTAKTTTATTPRQNGTEASQRRTERPKTAPARTPRSAPGGTTAGSDSKPSPRSIERKTLSSVQRSDVAAKSPTKRSESVPSPRQSDGTPKTGSTPSSKSKTAVGAVGSPKLKTVQSRIGSLDNAKHSPGGGNVKIQSKKIDLKGVESKCGSKDNIKHKPRGGERKIFDEKPQWKTESKIGSLDNTKHKAGGGVKKIESHKLDFKDKAKSKVGSKDKINHKPGGGNVTIQDEKLDFKEKATAKVGSKDNMNHQPGGGSVLAGNMAAEICSPENSSG